MYWQILLALLSARILEWLIVAAVKTYRIKITKRNVNIPE
jgi:hypothetical protein